MKVSTILAVLAMGFAVVTTGCKYDKAGAGDGMDGANGADIVGEDGANGLDIDGQDINAQGIDGTGGAESGLIAGASEGKFEDLYARCTDVSFQAVYFGFDSTVVPHGELGKIDAVAQHLTERGDRVVVIEGNCDERGSSEYNMALGENRAIIIRNYLVQSGITADRIQTRSYGAEKPAVDGHDESAWAANRRGEFAIFQK